jgi:hypothetical protein
MRKLFYNEKKINFSTYNVLVGCRMKNTMSINNTFKPWKFNFEANPHLPYLACTWLYFLVDNTSAARNNVLRPGWGGNKKRKRSFNIEKMEKEDKQGKQFGASSLCWGESDSKWQALQLSGDRPRLFLNLVCVKAKLENTSPSMHC